MTLIIEIANQNMKDELTQYGEIVFESRVINLIYLKVESEDVIEQIKSLPGVLNIEKETDGYSM